jgi:hypothetical protein
MAIIKDFVASLVITDIAQREFVLARHMAMPSLHLLSQTLLDILLLVRMHHTKVSVVLPATIDIVPQQLVRTLLASEELMACFV